MCRRCLYVLRPSGRDEVVRLTSEHGLSEHGPCEHDVLVRRSASFVSVRPTNQRNDRHNHNFITSSGDGPERPSAKIAERAAKYDTPLSLAIAPHSLSVRTLESPELGSNDLCGASIEPECAAANR
jgi:hypothetical protein